MKLSIPAYQKGISTLRFCTLLLFSFFYSGLQTQLLGQYNMPQNSVWTFSTYQGLNFLPGPGPTAITTSITTEEGSASVSDNSGNLLFFTGGISSVVGARIYDRTGAIMPNGASIVPFRTYSCTQAAAIVPVIGNPDQYYVFSLEQGNYLGGGWGTSTAPFCRLYYCIVDMTLNGGLGDVIASTIATPLDSGLSEKMTVVAGDNCDIWLLTHEKNAPHFKAYNISSSGISAPVVSTATGEIPTGPNAYKIGTIKVSPNRTMIANCVLNGAYGGGLDRLELLQFNPATGIVSGCQVLNNFTYQYDAEFSPDNSKLYAHIMGSKVYQYDLSLLPSIPAVISSEILVHTASDWGGQMKLGPDGKIYIQTNTGFLDRINSPNLAGSACSYNYHAINLGSSLSASNIGMPNIQIVSTLDTIQTYTDTTLCAIASTISAAYGASSYLWSNGDTTQATTLYTNGIYWVQSVHGCDFHIDTFNVTIAPATLIPTVETTTSFCSGLSAVLTAPSGYSSHAWNTGATSASITASTAGTYWVADSAFSTCSLYVDTFHVTTTPPTLIPTITTTSFCSGLSAVLTAPSGYSSPVWNTGATTASITTSTAGTYWVSDTVHSTCSLYVDTFYVAATPPTLIPAITTTSFCSGLSAVLTAPSGYSSPVWNTGATTASVTVSTAGTYWVSDTAFSTCSLYVDTFYVVATPPTLIPAITTTSFCSGLSAVLTAPSGYSSPVWNTGAATASVTVSTAGTFWVADTVFSTCSLYIDTFHVTATPVPVVALGNDKTICPGDTLVLLSSMSEGVFLWSNYSTDPSITINTGGTYFVTVTYEGCSASDTINISQLSPPTPIVLGPDTVLCNGDEYVLQTGIDATMWSTGVVANNIIVSSPGIYSATVENECGTSTSSITVDYEPCDLTFPNAFTPNNDGKNDIARAIGNLGAFRNYSLSIYNRFGERVFYTEDIYAGWNGIFKNTPQDLGVFFYYLTCTRQSKRIFLKGDLTLIR